MPRRLDVARPSDCGIQIPRTLDASRALACDDTSRDKTRVMGGAFAEASAPARLRSFRKFDSDWTDGTTRVSPDFCEQDDGTQLTLTVLYASKEAGDGAATSGMTGGMEHDYARLDEILSGLR